MIKKSIVFLLLLSVAVLAAGCRQKAVYDREQFNNIDAYVKEIIPAIEETRFDFDLWAADLGSVEKKSWLQMDAERIGHINQLHFTEDFPPYEEIKEWVVPVSNGEKKWTIQGNKLAPALEQMELSSEELVLMINEIVQADDVAFLAGKREEIRSALTRTLETAEILSSLFYINKGN